MKFQSRPVKQFLLFLVVVCFYATSFAAETLVAPDTRIQPRQTAEKPQVVKAAISMQTERVIIKFKDNHKIRFTSGSLISKNYVQLSAADEILKTYYANSFRRLFNSQTIEQLDKSKEIYQYKTGTELADLNSYYSVSVTSTAEAVSLVEELNRLEYVEIAYFEPLPEPAVDIPPTTPLYEASQLYLDPAPAGVDADYAHTLPGGDGSGIRIVDIEGNWQTTHEDLDKAASGFLVGNVIDDISYRNHGTAVIGVMIGSDNGYGVTGISPGADLGMVGVGSISVAEAIYTAIDSLQSGDVILIELHAPGPHFDFEVRQDQLGYVCMEYWQANFDAIRYAWAKGIVVVEAGGNGAENFDDIALYGSLFDTTYRNSHALIVGAGYPASSGLDLQRQSFSNYGERVNLQGYGSGVYTTGYGDLFTGGGDENQFYTTGFSGTSSASPIITGSVACLQGYMKANFGSVLTSDYIRDIFYQTGTSQAGNLSEHIGPRPDLNAAINSISAPPSLSANPIYIDTMIEEGTSITMDLWLKNSSTTDNINYFIYDRDTTNKVFTNWLEVNIQQGVVPANDSSLITVILDATDLTQRSVVYSGLIDVLWGHGAASLDSSLLVPVYLEVPCTDSTFSVLSSDDIGGPVYNWISAKDSGIKIDNNDFYNALSAIPLDDGTAGPFPIGFSFPYYTDYYDSFYVGVNGAISFTDPDLNVNGYFSNLVIPGVPFESFLSPFWNDLIIDEIDVPEAGVYLYTNATLDTTVIEWYRLSNFNQVGDTLTDFELILTSDGNITAQYQSVGLSGLEQLALVGIAEIDCNSYSYVNGGDKQDLVVSDNEAVRFTNHLYFGQTGDLNGIPPIDIADLVYLVSYMFDSGPHPIPQGAADVDCSGDVDIADLVYLVSYMFGAGPEPCSQWLHDGGS